VAAGADEARRATLGDFGYRVGLGLQMLDDLGGLTGERRRHKGFEDLRLGRLTWPWAWAVQQEQDVGYTRLRDLARDVRSGRAPAERLAARLREIVGDTGRDHVRESLADALAALSQAVGPSDLLAALSEEITRLEESYD
jgi:geranylgeranyl pyrophosphate synthase